MTSQISDVENLVQQILSYKGKGDLPYVEKYDKNWIVRTFEEKSQIQMIEKGFKLYDDNGADLIDFTRIFLNSIEHAEDETLYLTISLIDLFKDICESYGLKSHVKSKDVLNYIVENFLSKNMETFLIPTRKIPETKKFGTEATEIRDIDVNAPIIYGEISGGIKRLKNTKITTDSIHHNNSIRRACFSEETKRIFALESLADHILVYDLNCFLLKKIYPKNLNEKGDVLILDFTWSSKQQRIGAVSKDFTMSFWDANDNFTFEKKFNIANFCNDYQISIWYLNSLNIWITSDKTNSMNIWDIEKETKTSSISSNKIKSTILDIIELEVLKLVAVSSLDKMVTIWDLRKRHVVMELDLTKSGVHSIKWSRNYHIFITAGFENDINLWSINPKFFDISLKGKLVGHAAMVTAVETIDKTSMVISADDQAILRIWDIRNMNCIQLIPLGLKSPINLLLDTYKHGKLGFVGNRINFIDFDDASDIQRQIKAEEQVWPSCVDYNFGTDEIIVCTRKDIRFVDIETGRTKKIYAGLLKNDGDEIATFKLMQQNKKFIIGSERGKVGLYSYATGELMKTLESHANEVVHIKVDYVNNLILTSGWDSALFIQKEGPHGPLLKRSIKNLHSKKEVSILELSVYHNLIVTTTNNNVLYVWDYEYCRVMASITIKEGLEPAFVNFINGYSYLIIGDTGGMVYFLHFKRRDLIEIAFEVKATINLNSSSFVTKSLIELKHLEKSESVESCNLYLSTNRGEVRIYDMKPLFESESVKIIPSSQSKSNCNPDRIAHEDFIVSLKSYKIYDFNVEQALRVGQSPLSLDRHMRVAFKAHKDSLTTLNLIDGAEKRILTSSLDHYIRFWRLDGTLLASLNINHPLPIIWNLTPNNSNAYQKKVLYALKVVETIFKRNTKTLFIPEAKKISVNLFIKNFQNASLTPNTNHLPSEQASRSTSRVRPMLMADAFTTRDLQFDKAKVIYKRELQGPTLRQMALLQRINQSEKTSNDFVLREQNNELIEQQYQKVAEEEREKNEFMAFLVGDLRQDLMKDSHYSETTKVLARKLENLSLKKGTAGDVEKVYAPPPNPRRRDSFTFLTGLMQKGNPQDTSKRRDEDNSNLEAKPTLKFRESIPKIKGFPEGLKLQKIEAVTPKDDVALTQTRSKTERMRNGSVSIRHNKSIRSNSSPKIDFFSYAQDKLLLENSQSEKKMPLSARDSGTPSSQYSSQSSKKVHKFKFGRILNKLEENLKRSQNSSVPMTMRTDLRLDQMTTQPTSRILTLKNTDQPDTTTDSESESNYLNFMMTLQAKSHVRTMSLPTLKEGNLNFLKHLDDTKKKLEEQWNIKPSSLMVKKALSPHLMSKMLPLPTSINQLHFSKRQASMFIETPLQTTPRNHLL